MSAAARLRSLVVAVLLVGLVVSESRAVRALALAAFAGLAGLVLAYCLVRGVFPLILYALERRP